MTTTMWRLQNRLGVDALYETELEALELAARLGWGSRVTQVIPIANDTALALLPGEVVEEVKRVKGAFYREAIGELAVRAGLLQLVETVEEVR